MFFFPLEFVRFPGLYPVVSSLDGRKPCVFPCCLGLLLLAPLGFSCIAWRPRNGMVLVGQRGESFLAVFWWFLFFGDFLQQMMSLWLDFGGVYFGKKDPNSTYISSVLEYKMPWAFAFLHHLPHCGSFFIFAGFSTWPSKLQINNWSVNVFFPGKSLHGSLAAELKRTAAGYEHLPSLVLILLNLWVLMCISTLLAITLRPKAMELMGFCLFCVYVCFEKLVRIENDAFVSVYVWWFLIFVKSPSFHWIFFCNWGTLVRNCWCLIVLFCVGLCIGFIQCHQVKRLGHTDPWGLQASTVQGKHGLVVVLSVLEMTWAVWLRSWRFMTIFMTISSSVVCRI